MGAVISVITLSHNCREELKKTVSSVLSQADVSFEYIIVDGLSSDGTIEFLQTLSSSSRVNLKVICEKDKGVYDAMNKAVLSASGLYSIFLNSGDYFTSADVLSNLLPHLSKNADVLYGDTVMRYDGGSYLNRSKTPSIDNPMPFIHQSALVKTELMSKFPFDDKLRILADHKLFYTLFNLGYSFCYVPITISSYNAQHGLSAENPYQQFVEHAIIHGEDKLRSWPIRKLYYVIRFGLHMRLRRVLPKWLEDRLILLRKRNLYEILEP